MSQFEIPFSIYTHLSDRYCRLSVPGIAQLFQEAAEMNCCAKGVGYPQLIAQHKAWVLSRVSYRIIERFPRLDEKVKLRTWYRGTDGLYAHRDFEILSAMNEVLVAATSLWVIIDYDTRRVVRLRNEMDSFEQDNHVALAIEPAKLVMPKDMQKVQSFNAPYSSVDKAHHVNNAEYIRWMMDVLSPEINEKGLSAIDINYIKETQPDELVEIFKHQDNNTTWIKIINPHGTSVSAKLSV